MNDAYFGKSPNNAIEGYPKMYRYEDIDHAPAIDEWGSIIRYNTPSIRVHLSTYNVIKKTLKGKWISLGYGDKKFVLDKARKRFAHETKEAALISFIRRKETQIKIVERQLERAKIAFNIGANMLKKMKEEKENGVLQF